MEKFDYVIILCPSELRISTNSKNEYFDELSEDKKRLNSLYLGGQVRMEAAVDIVQFVQNFIVVGGSEIKVTGMRDYLLRELQKETKENEITPKIIRIESEPDTNGNLWAIKRWIKNYKIKFLGKRIGILTNFYHLPRTIRLSKDILPEYYFIPLVAESLITRHQSTYSFYPKEFLLRICSEVDGLRDWENEKYRNQHKDESEWKSIFHDTDLLPFLETETHQ